MTMEAEFTLPDVSTMTMSMQNSYAGNGPKMPPDVLPGRFANCTRPDLAAPFVPPAKTKTIYMYVYMYVL